MEADYRKLVRLEEVEWILFFPQLLLDNYIFSIILSAPRQTSSLTY